MVIGGGIVGAAVAAELAAVGGLAVVVVERGPRDRLLGSTAHASGFVGLLGDTPVLSEVAPVSAAIYESVEHSSQAGFHRTGGLELAETEEGLTELARRATRAREHGLPAHNLERREAIAFAPNLINAERCVGGVLYPQDGERPAHSSVPATTLKPQRRHTRLD